MDNRASIATLLSEIDKMTPGGFAIGLHIGFSGPGFLFQTFPVDWVEYYAEHGLQLHDPALLWGFTNTGFVRWYDLIDDPKDVMKRAYEHGLTHGVTISFMANQTRTVAGFARSDRDYLDAEIDMLTKKLMTLHSETAGLQVLSKSDLEALKKMSIRLSHT